MQTQRLNEFGQPIGADVPNWTPRAHPGREMLHGQYCRLEPLSAERHADSLFQAYQRAEDGRDWTYLPIGPFDDRSEFGLYLQRIETSEDPLHYTAIDMASGLALGTLALMRVDSAHGVIEVGLIAYSPALKHTRIATEAQFLFMKYVFDTLGYRRYEWKCDSLNEPSRNAALRLGFRYEGIFRNAWVYKGRSRDTAWYSIIDTEWPQLRQAYETWLSPDNFDTDGRQRSSLSLLTSQAVSQI